MASLSSAAKYLAEYGLQVVLNNDTSMSCVREGDLSLDLQYIGDQFRLSHWSCTPGPGENDFQVCYQSLDEALLAVWCFYFAPTIEINGWHMPLHRRPYWQLPRVLFRMTNVTHIDAAQFESIRARRVYDAQGFPTMTMNLLKNHTESRLDAANRSQFLRCWQADDSTLTLMLRRDLDEGYIVSDLAKSETTGASG